MDMPVRDFERLESFIVFKNEYKKTKDKKVKNDKAKSKIVNLPETDISKLGFSEEQLRGIYG